MQGSSRHSSSCWRAVVTFNNSYGRCLFVNHGHTMCAEWKEDMVVFHLCSCVIRSAKVYQSMWWRSSLPVARETVWRLNCWCQIICCFFVCMCVFVCLLMLCMFYLNTTQITLIISGTISSSWWRGTFPVLCSTCSWWVTTNVGKPSAIGQPTRPTQPFILSGSKIE